MKVVSLIVALILAMAPGAPAQPAQAPLAGATAEHVITVAVDTTSPGANDDDAGAFAAPGPSTYLLLALGLFGMGLVSRRRQAD